MIYEPDEAKTRGNFAKPCILLKRRTGVDRPPRHAAINSELAGFNPPPLPASIIPTFGPKPNSN
jgi:hypothetical protein